MNRTERAFRDHYIKALHDFTHERLAPPPSVVARGELPSTEATAQLLTLHDDAVGRVRTKVPGFDAAVARSGREAVVTPLLRELAALYGVRLGDLHEGLALRADPDALYDREAQPRCDDGTLDMAVLGPECDAEFDRLGWADRECEVDGYATPYDPRLPLVRSRVALRPEGVAWVSCARPQNFQLARFDGLRQVHRQSNQWLLEFDDWRRRRLAGRADPPGWEAFLERLRERSTDAGFVWDTPTAGRPDLGPDVVDYDLSEWAMEARMTLSRSLGAAGVPHEWQGTTLRAPQEHEADVDQAIEVA